MFEKLSKRKQSIEDNRQRLKAEIEELQAKEKALEDQARKSAEAGDIDGYMKVKAEIEKAKAASEVKSIQLAGIGDLNRGEICAEWAEYRREYDKRFDAAHKSAEEAKQAFLSAFLTLLKVQNEGVRERSRFGGLLGASSGSARILKVNMEEDLSRVLPLKTIRTLTLDDVAAGSVVACKGRNFIPEAGFYVANNPGSFDAVLKVLAGVLPVSEESL